MKLNIIKHIYDKGHFGRKCREEIFQCNRRTSHWRQRRPPQKSQKEYSQNSRKPGEDIIEDIQNLNWSLDDLFVIKNAQQQPRLQLKSKFLRPYKAIKIKSMTLIPLQKLHLTMNLWTLPPVLHIWSLRLMNLNFVIYWTGFN